MPNLRVVLRDVESAVAEGYELRQGVPAIIPEADWDDFPDNIKLLCDVQEFPFDPDAVSPGGGGATRFVRIGSEEDGTWDEDNSYQLDYVAGTTIVTIEDVNAFDGSGPYGNRLLLLPAAAAGIMTVLVLDYKLLFKTSAAFFNFVVADGDASPTGLSGLSNVDNPNYPEYEMIVSDGIASWFDLTSIVPGWADRLIGESFAFEQSFYNNEFVSRVAGYWNTNGQEPGVVVQFRGSLYFRNPSTAWGVPGQDDSWLECNDPMMLKLEFDPTNWQQDSEYTAGDVYGFRAPENIRPDQDWAALYPFPIVWINQGSDPDYPEWHDTQDLEITVVVSIHEGSTEPDDPGTSEPRYEIQYHADSTYSGLWYWDGTAWNDLSAVTQAGDQWPVDRPQLGLAAPYASLALDSGNGKVWFHNSSDPTEWTDLTAGGGASPSYHTIDLTDNADIIEHNESPLTVSGGTLLISVEGTSNSNMKRVMLDARIFLPGTEETTGEVMVRLERLLELSPALGVEFSVPAGWIAWNGIIGGIETFGIMAELGNPTTSSPSLMDMSGSVLNRALGPDDFIGFSGSWLCQNDE